jgi:hypothetical protein
LENKEVSIVVSYSEIFKYQVCVRQYYYRFILGLAPIEESDAISTGVKGHKLLQDFYELLREGKDKEEAFKHVTENANKLMKSESFTDFSLLKAWTLVDNYIRETDFTSEAIIIENRYLFPAAILSDDPLLTDVQIGFTPDVVFERPSGRIDIEDAKFVQRAWSKSKLNRFQQVKLYQVFLDRMGYDISRGIVRFFNLATAKSYIQVYTMGEFEEKTLIHDFMAGVKDVVRFKTQSHEELALAPRTMNYTACQFCQFEFPCTLEAEGKDASKTLDSQFVKSTYDYNR